MEDTSKETIERLSTMNNYHADSAHHLHGQLSYVRGVIRRLVTYGGVITDYKWSSEGPYTPEELREAEQSVRDFFCSYQTDEINGWPEMKMLMETVIALRQEDLD